MSKKLKFYSASTTKVEKYQKEIKKLLKIMDFEEAYVTDESLIADFYFIKDSEENDRLNEVCKKLGFGIVRGDFLVDIAERLHNQKKRKPKNNAKK